MINYLKGQLTELTPTQATIDCHGVGYAVNISLNTYTAIQGKNEALLYIYESIREDAWTLFGFVTKQERELFLLLISVSGIGGNTARTILSSFSASELANIIMDGNERLLKSVKGLGAKTAQRIIVELKDKVAKGFAAGIDLENVAGAASDTAAAQGAGQAIAALVSLGYSQSEAALAVSKIDGTLPVEEIIKLALRSMAGRR